MAADEPNAAASMQCHPRLLCRCCTQSCLLNSRVRPGQPGFQAVVQEAGLAMERCRATTDCPTECCGAERGGGAEGALERQTQPSSAGPGAWFCCSAPGRPRPGHPASQAGRQHCRWPGHDLHATGLPVPAQPRSPCASSWLACSGISSRRASALRLLVTSAPKRLAALAVRCTNLEAVVHRACAACLPGQSLDMRFCQSGVEFHAAQGSHARVSTRLLDIQAQ